MTAAMVIKEIQHDVKGPMMGTRLAHGVDIFFDF